MMLLALLIILFALADIWLTRRGLKENHKELNPLARFFSMRVLYFLRLAVAVFLAVTGYFIADVPRMAAMTAMFGLVAAWNFTILRLGPSKKVRRVMFQNAMNA